MKALYFCSYFGISFRIGDCIPGQTGNHWQSQVESEEDMIGLMNI